MKKIAIITTLCIIAAMFAAAMVPVSAASIDDGMVLYLSFDNEVSGVVPDLTENGWNAALKGHAKITSDNAKFGKALYLDGTDSYAELPVGVNLALDGDSWAISTWCTIEELRNFQRVFDFNSTSATFFYMSPSTSDMIATYRAKVNNGTRDTLDSWSILMDEGEWYHIAVSQEGTTVTFYINGEVAETLEGCVNNMATYEVALEQNWLGKSATAADAMYLGAIDEFRMYNRALSEEDVAALYAYKPEVAESTVISDVKIDIVEEADIVEEDGGIESDLLVYLPFDEANDGVSADATGNGWDASLMGTAAIDAEGKFGGALSLDGAEGGNYAQIKEGVNLALDSEKAEWTISLWFTQSEARKYARLIDFNNTNSTFFYIAAVADNDEGTYRAKINGGTRDTVNFEGAKTEDNTWYMVTVVQHGDSIKVYVNGEFVIENRYCTNSNMATYGEALMSCWLGKSATEADPMFVGKMDEFRLYNRALSANDIAALYALDPAAAAAEEAAAEEAAAEETVEEPAEAAVEETVEPEAVVEEAETVVEEAAEEPAAETAPVIAPQTVDAVAVILAAAAISGIAAFKTRSRKED